MRGSEDSTGGFLPVSPFSSMHRTPEALPQSSETCLGRGVKEAEGERVLCSSGEACEQANSSDLGDTEELVWRKIRTKV